MRGLAPRRLALGGLLDRYVGQIFWAAYALTALVVLGLYLVVDLATNLEEYVRPDASGARPPSTEILRYYALHSPFLYLQVAPFVTLIAGLFTVSRLQRSREVTAALGAGISARRLLLPLLAAAVLLALLMGLVREYATTALGPERDGLRARLTAKAPVLVLENVRVKDSAGQSIQLARYQPGSSTGAEDRPPRFEALDAVRLVEGRWFRYQAAAGTWQESAGEGHWQLADGWREEVEVFDEGAVLGGKQRVPLVRLEGGSGAGLAFSPPDVLAAWKARENPLELSYGEALALSRRDPDNLQYRTLLAYLVAFPVANLVLLLVGLPFLLQYERGRGAQGLVAGFLLCVFYFATDFVTLTLGMEGQIGPYVAGGLPPVLFGSLGVVLFGSART
ncbi:MAG TPA: LptF/LptG family permease [Planctomycetota bacterium]|nr:LptF/LptG family permease [Planctomycetota bacterium]